MTMVMKEGTDFSDARHHAGCIERGGTAMHQELSEKDKKNSVSLSANCNLTLHKMMKLLYISGLAVLLPLLYLYIAST